MIPDNEQKILGHARILEFHKFYSEYHFWLEADDSRFRVTIRIYETNDGRFHFVQSHFIRTPIQDEAFSPTVLSHATSHLALSTGVESIVTYYDDAVAHGHAPIASWFVENELF